MAAANMGCSRAKMVRPCRATPREGRPALRGGKLAFALPSARDRAILDVALRKLGGAVVDFEEALRALREATEELIPAGRTYYLGATAQSPIVGSIISGVGIVASNANDGARGVRVVRVRRDGGMIELGALGP
jgi:hypothetical protein